MQTWECSSFDNGFLAYSSAPRHYLRWRNLWLLLKSARWQGMKWPAGPVCWWRAPPSLSVHIKVWTWSTSRWPWWHVRCSWSVNSQRCPQWKKKIIKAIKILFLRTRRPLAVRKFLLSSVLHALTCCTLNFLYSVFRHPLLLCPFLFLWGIYLCIPRSTSFPDSFLLALVVSVSGIRY